MQNSGATAIRQMTIYVAIARRAAAATPGIRITMETVAKVGGKLLGDRAREIERGGGILYASSHATSCDRRRCSRNAEYAAVYAAKRGATQ